MINFPLRVFHSNGKALGELFPGVSMPLRGSGLTRLPFVWLVDLFYTRLFVHRIIFVVDIRFNIQRIPFPFLKLCALLSGHQVASSKQKYVRYNISISSPYRLSRQYLSA